MKTETKKLDTAIDSINAKICAMLDTYYAEHDHEEIFCMDNNFANALAKLDDAREALISARFQLTGSKI